MSAACGYSLAGRGSFLPDYIKTLGIPLFLNRTPFLTAELMFTEKVRVEFQSRGRYHVQPSEEGADGIVRGEIAGISAAPVGFTDAQLATRYRFTVVVSVKFDDATQKKTLWENPALALFGRVRALQPHQQRPGRRGVPRSGARRRRSTVHRLRALSRVCDPGGLLGSVKPAEIRKQIKSGETGPLYLLEGDDRQSRHDLAMEFAAVVDEGLHAFNVQHFYANEATTASARDELIGDLLSSARTLPMMAPRRVIAVHEAERLLSPRKAKDEDQEVMPGLESTTQAQEEPDAVRRARGVLRLSGAVDDACVRRRFARRESTVREASPQARRVRRLRRARLAGGCREVDPRTAGSGSPDDRAAGDLGAAAGDRPQPEPHPRRSGEARALRRR